MLQRKRGQERAALPSTRGSGPRGKVQCCKIQLVVLLISSWVRLWGNFA